MKETRNNLLIFGREHDPIHTVHNIHASIMVVRIASSICKHLLHEHQIIGVQNPCKILCPCMQLSTENSITVIYVISHSLFKFPQGHSASVLMQPSSPIQVCDYL